ncbi:hypothetical protein [Sulfurimonas hydrogeniphila]|uniref:DUF7840 domain-containing protein n=1 Tax=Sulfurimonas hydrogeniphila TaxID=2509341 RepID=UPI00125ED092|nr:hypothetical protein [Sulfurimonas hydrogeniphila]
MNLHYRDINIKYNNINPLDKKPSALGIEYANNTNKEASIVLSYRPLYSDIYDFDYNKLHENEFSIFNTEINIKKNSLSLDKLTLLSIKSYAKRTVFYKPISWQIYSGLNKNNIDTKIKLTNQIGLGITKQYFYRISASILCNIGLNNITPYIGSEIYISKYIGKNIKLGINSYVNVFSKNKNYYSNNIFLSFKQQNLLYTLKYNNKTNNKYFRFGIRYYF